MRRQPLRPGTAAILQVKARTAIAVIASAGGYGFGPDTVKAIEVLDVEPGSYVVVPVQLWEQTVRKAMIDPAAAPATTELEVNTELPPTRQQRRRARFDA